MAKQPQLTPKRNHYEILDLPSPKPGTRPSTEAIKQAYHKALLRHHPDKATPTENHWKAPHLSRSKYTVDEIVLAYKTLSNRSSRTQYDHSLSRQGEEDLQFQLVVFGRPTTTTQDGRLQEPGCETVDLDDLVFDEQKGVWYRGCRCGDEKGFVVTEEELEEWEAEKVVVTGCRGCSLWLRVEFEAADGIGHDEDRVSSS